MGSVKVLSPAKINIGLRVLRKRPDGYHDIETIFHEVKLFDEIEVEISDRIEFETDSSEVPLDFENLCLRSARIFIESFGIHSGVRIFLKKVIPVGAGLGGGSSDAAGVLKALNILFETRADEDFLCELAGLIGSDVPFFIRGGTAYATGRGEVIEQLQVDFPYKIVLVYPNIKISTAWAYGNLKLRDHAEKRSLKEIFIQYINSPENLRMEIENDFEELVFSHYPEVGKVKAKLYELGALFSLMSGSGSTVFGFFDEIRDEDEVLSAFGGYRVFILR
jgi:4-diphosphocytidyl-2-C-methyl-D-erythritol kinase